ncbi:MAG: DNA polymerase-4 [Planctomycetota bacterium]|jgi:DNA polymerase-4
MKLPARILHLDVDAFLASVEQSVHPELRGLPVVVGGPPTGRNLVMSCSYESRPFGVRPGIPLAMAARLCPQAVFRNGDSQAANRLREKLTRILFDFTPLVEVASIDDFFLDLTGTERLLGPPIEVAARIRRRALNEVALPLTIGIGSNRLIARIAGKLGKPGGVAEIWSGYERTLLRGLPIRELPGVGHAIGRQLESFAIRTVGDLCHVSREVLFASFGNNGLQLFDRARGIDNTPVEVTSCLLPDGTLVNRPPKSIQRISTFEPEEGRREMIEAMLAYLVERAAYRLRQNHLFARRVETRISYVDTRTYAERKAAVDDGLFTVKRRTLAVPSDSTDELREVARLLLREMPRRRALVKRVGVTLNGLVTRAGWQGQLFSTGGQDRDHDHGGSHADRHRKLDHVVDELREKLGFGRLLSGTSLELKSTHPLTRDGFKLRTPSLNQ